MAAKKPNILILWGDDIGMWNISRFNLGMMGYRTPNIDRIAAEGVTFTDYYSQQSCTAGRACFITGQNPIRTGLTKVGMPGATVGLQKEDPTIAELLKPLGYATGQFGRTIWATATNSCPPCMVSTSSSAISTISTRRKNLNCRTIPKTGIQEAVWSPWRAPLLERRQGRTDDQGHRPLTKKRMERSMRRSPTAP